LADIAAVLPTPGHAPRKRPDTVGSATICWPLGLDMTLTPEDLCLQRRSAWVLHGATPPTLPDRDTGRGLLRTIWVDPATGLRTSPSCTARALPRQKATWPTATLPWLSRRGIGSARL